MDTSKRFAAASLLMLLAGCGDWAGSERPVPVTVSMSDPDFKTLPPDGARLADAGDQVNGRPDSPLLDECDAILNAIIILREQPLPEEPKAAQTIRRKRNQRIVKLAAKVVALTVDQTAKQKQFHKAVSEMLESRFQLAIDDSDEDMQQLYADVRTLDERDPVSLEAADGVWYLARFAHAKARRVGDEEPIWFENFARWAREFARRFPQDVDRAVALLSGAGRSCEMHALGEADAETSRRLMLEARSCYEQLTSHYAATSEAQEAAAVLRRLSLPGQRLTQFAGPTLSGEFLDAGDLTGQVALIYFWSLENQEFRDHLLPLLKEAEAETRYDLKFVGVPLDEDEATLRSFIKSQSVPGQQIFFTEPGLRSWNNPLIRFWGLSRIPSVWLINKRNQVFAVDVRTGSLKAAISRLFD